MTRARFYDVSTDPAGRPVPGVTVNVYTTGTTTPLPVTIYAAATGGATRANPFVTSTGVVDFWLEDPAVVDLKYTIAGYGTQTQTVEVVEATPPATAVTVTPVGGLVSTTAQAALAELDADLTAEAAARAAAIDAHEVDPVAHAGTYPLVADLTAETNARVAADLLRITGKVQTTAPSAPSTNDVWIDTSSPADALPLASSVANAVSLPGTSGNWVSTPDSATISLVGDLTVEVNVEAGSDWGSATAALFSKWDGTGSQKSWMLQKQSNQLIFYTSANGATTISHTCSALLTLAVGDVRRIKVTVDVDNGASGHDVKFWTLVRGGTWTQLGTTITTAGVTTIFDGTATMRLGSRGEGTELYNGKIYDALLRTGVDGTVVAFFDATVIRSAARLPASVTCGTTVWTPAGTGWDWVRGAAA